MRCDERLDTKRHTARSWVRHQLHDMDQGSRGAASRADRRSTNRCRTVSSRTSRLAACHDASPLSQQPEERVRGPSDQLPNGSPVAKTVRSGDRSPRSRKGSPAYELKESLSTARSRVVSHPKRNHHQPRCLRRLRCRWAQGTFAPLSSSSTLPGLTMLRQVRAAHPRPIVQMQIGRGGNRGRRRAGGCRTHFRTQVRTPSCCRRDGPVRDAGGQSFCSRDQKLPFGRICLDPCAAVASVKWCAAIIFVAPPYDTSDALQRRVSVRQGSHTDVRNAQQPHSCAARAVPCTVQPLAKLSVLLRP